MDRSHANQPDPSALLDLSYIRDVQEAVGASAMQTLVAAFLRDCREGQARLANSPDQPAAVRAKEAHRLAGMLVQFGCPEAGNAFRAASHAAPQDLPALLAKAMALAEPTCAALETLFSKQIG